jgi:hypothetical protein
MFEIGFLIAGMALLGCGLFLASRQDDPSAWALDPSSAIRVGPLSKEKTYGSGTFLWLEVHGDVAFGPVPAIVKTSQAVALAAGNPTRNSKLPGGDAAVGSYEVQEVVNLSGASGPLRTALGERAILLKPISQSAREMSLHGGTMTDGSDGGIKISDDDLAQLCEVIGNAKGLRCVFSN